MKTRYVLGVASIVYLVAIVLTFNSHPFRANLLGLAVVVLLMPISMHGAHRHIGRYPEFKVNTMRWVWAFEAWLLFAACMHAIGIMVAPSDSAAAYAIIPAFTLLLVVFVRLDYYETAS